MKKLFSILLSLAMLLSLAACGGETSTERVEEKAPAEEPAAGGEAAGDTIKIGMYTAMTGVNGGSGLCLIDGVTMAMNEVNEAGGIDGRMLELITYDNAGSTEGSTKAVTRLIEEDGVQAIIGCFSTPNVVACTDMCEEAKVLLLGNGTGLSWTNCGLDYTFRSTANAILPINTMIELMVDQGVGSTSLISSESEYGQSGRASITEGLAAAGIELKADLSYQSGDTDFTGIITKALAAEADTIILYGLGQELAMLTKQTRQNGYEGIIYTTESAANVEMFTVAGPAADGVVFSATYIVPPTPEEAPTAMMQELLAEHYEWKGEMPYSDVIYRGYDAMSLLAEALKNCDDVNSGESIRNAFVELSGIELMGGNFDYTDATGDGLGVANQYMIMDGKIHVYDKATAAAWPG